MSKKPACELNPRVGVKSPVLVLFTSPRASSGAVDGEPPPRIVSGERAVGIRRGDLSDNREVVGRRRLSEADDAARSVRGRLVGDG